MQEFASRHEAPPKLWSHVTMHVTGYIHIAGCQEIIPREYKEHSRCQYDIIVNDLLCNPYVMSVTKFDNGLVEHMHLEHHDSTMTLNVSIHFRFR